MSYGSGLRKGTHERLIKACETDPSIIADSTTLSTHAGSTLAYLETLGLLKSDLKRLERYGFAMRGYTKNVWLPGETLPNGKKATGEYIAVDVKKKVPMMKGIYERMGTEITEVKVPKTTHRGNGHKVRWVLLAGK